VSNSGTNDIASVSLQTQQLVGNFSGSQSDDGSANGIGLAVNPNFLYASFTASNTIAAFSLRTGCGLTFLGDVPAIGLQGGSVSGMAVNGSILVVAYGDGSIQSFNVTNGLPVSNNDRQNSTGYGGSFVIGSTSTGNMPSGVDITRDGKFAIFGDISATSTVEVSSLSSGKLAKTVSYSLGTAVDAGSIRLSPDQSLLYVANSESGTVMAAFFNTSTGKITRGCTSPTLRGFNVRPWLGAVVPRDPTGTGSLLYVAEYGRDNGEINHGQESDVGILTVTSNGTTCTLTETSTSPVSLVLPGVLSIGVYPPRPF
jgi:6-phosphogluconolactonase (cycloisomerase 2 family)